MIDCDIKNFNPSLTIIPYKVNDEVTVNVVRDDILLGGTFQRAMVKFIEHFNIYDEFVYSGYSSDFIQIALTIVCTQMYKKVTLFIHPDHDLRLTFWCQKLGANVKLYYNDVKNAYDEALLYVESNNAYLVSSELPLFANFLHEELVKIIPLELNPERLWLTDLTLLKIFSGIWNDTKFYFVQVNEKLNKDDFDSNLWNRTNKLTASQAINVGVYGDTLPPYPTRPNYDGKIWSQMVRYGQNGDYIWNSFSDIETLRRECDIHTYKLQTFESRRGASEYNLLSADYLPKNIIKNKNIRDNLDKNTYAEYINSAKKLVPLVRNNTIWFPFQRYIKLDPDQIFENLIHFDLPIHQTKYQLKTYSTKNGFYLSPLFRGKSISMINNQSDYKNFDILSDFFIEDIRLRSKRYDQEYSTLQCWEVDNCLERILANALRYENITPETMRKAIYYEIRETGTFQVTRAKALIKLALGSDTKDKKWLDISSGWGDRLLTAMSLDMIYTGYDPNIELKPGHDAMIERFGKFFRENTITNKIIPTGSNARHKIYYEPFEKAIITDGPYDIVMTSPPFYDIEKYSVGQEGQSITNYPTFNDWVVNFLFASLIKAWDNLKEGGYLMLHLADAHLLDVCEMTNIFIENNLPGSSWEGIIGVSGISENYRPVWCYQKLSRYENLNRWIGKINTIIPRTLYYYHPKIQKELIKYYSKLFIKENNNVINNDKVDTVKNTLYQYYPNLHDPIDDLFVNLMLSSMIEVLGIDNTIKWCVAMIKMSLFSVDQKQIIKNSVINNKEIEAYNTFSTKNNNLNIEYSRWNMIFDFLKETQKGLSIKLKYEMKNILERWILSLCNDKEEKGDVIFSLRKLNPEYPATKKMLQEINSKEIPKSKEKYGYIIQSVKRWLTTKIINITIKIQIVGDTIQINEYDRTLPPGKLKILLDINPSLELLGTMIMRYACLLIGGQQWALPKELHQYLVEQYDVTIEGFASPVNSQIITISKDLNYCSLFVDTDAVYSSLGDFFNINFSGHSVYANPPYVDNIMNNVTDKIIEECSFVNKSSFVRFFITVPEWEDAIFYQKLQNSQFKVFEYSFSPGKHYYVDTNDGYKKVPVHSFGTHLFILAIGINDSYDKYIEFAEKIYAL